MVWRWRRVGTPRDAVEYIAILQHDKIALGVTDYPNTDAEQVYRFACLPAQGKYYWIGESGEDRICYMIRALPTDQGQSLIVQDGRTRVEWADRRNEPRMQNVGAKPARKGKLVWVRLFREAIAASYAHVRATAPMLRANSAWRTDRFWAAPISKHRGEAYRRAILKLADVREDTLSADDACWHFYSAVGDGNR